MDDSDRGQRPSSSPYELIYEVPGDIYARVFKHLDVQDLANCSRACKLWRRHSAELMAAWGEELLSAKFGFSMD